MPDPNVPTDLPPTILLRDVHLTLGTAAGEVNILRGLDFSVGQGETVGVVGPSGSGKSTMMMVIAGLEKATSGEVRVAGVDLSVLTENGLALFRRGHIGIVFQNFHLIPTMTALENVAVPLELSGRADAFARAAEKLEAVGLGRRLEHYPAQLSGGEQQRVALARAFVAEPPLLLADEPTGNLDGTTGSQVIELMFDLHRRRGTTLVLITHDPALARRCGRVVRLADGRITAEDGSDDGRVVPLRRP
ncbi:MAG: ABC transporter ATP-binding protein [Alphaproteobacteria bacterium]|nr:ABC transporter ATP-binding protein [Alphaproteobacteria bacterium]